LEVTDNEGATDTDIVTITVMEVAANEEPIAEAGVAQTVDDMNSDGVEDVTLDGSGSVDIDGTIEDYVWSEGGIEIATGVNPTLSFVVGVHIVTLEVTDNEGATDTDIVTITVGTFGEVIPLNSGESQSASVSEGDWVYYMIEAGSIYALVEVELSSLSSDVNLYVRDGELPTLAEYDCRPYTGGTSSETCSMVNIGENTWFIGVHGYTAGSFTISATLEEPASFDQIVDNESVGFTSNGSWYSSTLVSGYYGSDYLWAYGGSGDASAEWAFQLPSDGYYQVFVWWSAPYDTRSSDAPYSIYHANGSTTVDMDQRSNGSQWNDLGTYYFTMGEARVVVTNAASGVPVADAARIIFVGGSEPLND
jgi:hypothetical protein